MKKLLVALLVIFAGLFLMREPISLGLMARMMEQRLSAPAMPALPDGLHVALCGTGSPLPDPERSAACTLVIAGDRVFLFDAGSSANISAMGFNPGRIEAVFLTHFHSDHIGDLGEVMMQRWVSGNHTSPLPVYGPKGVEPIVSGFNLAYAQDSGYRTAHHGEAIAPTAGHGGAAHPFEVGAEGSLPVLTDSDLRISAFAVNHAPVHPALGYRIDYKGRSVVISGDTIYSENLIRAAKDADLLVHEGLSVPLVGQMRDTAEAAGNKTMAKIFADILDYHTGPEDAAKAAQEAGVKYLAFTHVVPMLPLPGLENAFLADAASHFNGPIHVGTDGDFFSLPAGSDTINFENRQ